MKQRMQFFKVAPEAYKAMSVLSQYMEHTSLTHIQQELIKTRASQVNGCAFCIDMHTRDARKYGETERRLYALNAWRETPFFTEEEQAILALVEEVTLISHHVSDETYDKAIAVLGEKVTAEVIMATIIINGWNRIGITTHLQPPAEI